MPVKKDPNGNRSVEAEVEVPGTPEEVWAAIASGKGISSWFVPTKVEEREGGAIACSFGPGMDSASTIKVWDPPRHFVAESRDDMGPNDPTVATEWIVEARDGGTCVVRVVHRWFTSKDDWDNQFEGHTHGWRAFFRVLKLYLTHFSGQASSAFQIMGVAPEPNTTAWNALMQSLGIAEPVVGRQCATTGDAPAFTGIVERVGQAEYPEELLLRLSQPAPGIVHLAGHPMGGKVYLSMRFFLYGDRAPVATAQSEPLWQAWINKHFPIVMDGKPVC